MELENDFSKLSNEIIKYLGIKNVYFSLSEGITALIKPLYIAANKWEVLSASKLPETGMLNIEFDNKKISVVCKVVHLNNNFNSYLLMFTEKLDQAFLDKLSNFNKITSEIDKRREERFSVGIDKWKEFGLTSPEVRFIFERKAYKCIINNASVHGALLTGETAPVSQNEDLINFNCSFEDPKTVILQKALLVNCNNLQNNYSRYSLQFLDPISFGWQQRIIKFGNIENKT